MNKPSKFLFYTVFVVVGVLIISGCAETTNIEACKVDKPSGFIGGLIHGALAPISFVISLFYEKVAIYDVNNTGGWYDFGFLIGAGVLFGGSSKVAKR